MARLLWAANETKKHLTAGYHLDERRVMELLIEKESAACYIYKNLRLNRAIIKETLRKLTKSRIHQVVLASIICATRFKFFEGNRCFLVRCVAGGGCQEPDSFPHLPRRAGQEIPQGGAEELVDFLTVLSGRAAGGDPGLPEPLRRAAAGEIELELPPSPLRPEGEISLK